MAEYGTTPVGRIIMGDPWNKTGRDQAGRPLPPEKQRYFFGLAVAKDAPGVNETLGVLKRAAMAGYGHAPHIVKLIQQGLSAQGFSWKVQDGDEQRVNPQTGVTEDRTPHGKGCWVFKFSTTLPIRAAKYQGNVPVDCSKDEIKRGYYVQVAFSASANGNMDHTAGIYLSPQTICLVGYGEEIVIGPSLEEQFTGGTGGYVPPGMTTHPQLPMGAPGPKAAPYGGYMPQHPQPPMGATSQQQPPMGAPGPQAAPYGGYMPQQQQPTMGAPTPQHPQPPMGAPGQQAAPYGGYMDDDIPF